MESINRNICEVVIENGKDHKELMAKENTVSYFLADWCGPCRMLAKDYEDDNIKDFLNSQNLKSIYVDADEHSKYVLDNFAIKNIPTIILGKVKNGIYQEQRIIGLKPAEVFKKRVKEFYK